MKKNLWKFIVMVIAAAVLSLAAVAIADTVLWKWVDAKGNVHYSKYLDQVPKKYRSKAVKVVIKSKESSKASSSSDDTATSKPTKKAKPVAKSKKKEEWQRRAVKAYNSVVQLEKDVKALKPKCDELRHKYLVMPTIANNQASIQCFKDLEKAKKDLAAARKYLEEGIYKKAENEGVPQEWIDEAIEEAKSKSSKKNE